ncbi:odorant receptor 13a [Chironomus tepperi]|uniref:odorant receptor 13a n=1 Tax=Chironomus tepperi TaxID=113505 RepID=UPI00391F71DA
MTPIVKILVSGEKTFPLDMKFPFDATSKFTYPLVLLWTDWNLINGLIIFFATDVLLYGFIRIISIEFEIIQHNFENLNLTESSDELKTLICHQNDLYDVCIKLEGIFSLTFFYKFIISSFVICFTAFQCSTSSDTSKIIVNMTICIANFNQIGLQCFFGQMLKNASENVTNSIYNCQWENTTNMKVKKSLMICITRSNRHVALTALKFSEITFEQLTYILTSTYSYFTLLRQIYNSMGTKHE